MRVTGLTAVAALLAAGAAAQTRPQAKQAPGTILEMSASFEELAQRVSRSVVQISVSGYALVPDAEAGRAASIARERATGSGVLLSADGFIVTNAHVVKNAQKVSVTIAGAAGGGVEDGGLPARIVGVDPETDLAVLKVARKDLPFLALADSDRVRQGQVVLAFGSPLGLFNSVTMGVVSSVGRQLAEEDFMQYIQTDAPINPGNSGGALVDGDGRVVGINTMIMSRSGGSEGVGFAIPANLVRDVYRQLKVRGHVHRGVVGVSVQNVNSILADGLKLKRRSGVLVSDVRPDGPADKGGLKAGDLVLSVDKVPVRNARHLELRVFRASAGQKLRLEVWRDGDVIPLDVEVAARPDATDKLAELADPQRNMIPQLAVLGLSVTKDMGPVIESLRQSWGVMVAAVLPNPVAANVDLQQGDVIHSVNTLMVTSVEALRESLDAMKKGDAVVLQVERDGALRYVGYRVE